MSVPIARVGDLAEQIRGVTYAKEDASDTPKPGYLPVLRAGNITDEGLVFDDFVFVPADRVSAKQRIRRHDILIAASSGSLDVVGKAAPALADFDGGFGAFCKVLRPNSKVHPAYLAQFLKTPQYRRRVSALAAGANINNLRNEHLDEMRVPLPPPPEQRRIAAILDKADELRAKRRAAFEQLNGLTQAIFLEMFGDPATNPNRWCVVPISTLLVSACYGTSAKAGAVGAFPILRMGNVTATGDIDAADLKFIDLNDADIHKFTVRVGDVLFNRTNSPHLVGKSAIVRTMTAPTAFAGYLIRLRVNDGNSPEYLSAFLNTAYAKRVLRGMCKTIIGMANINATEIQRMTIPKPPLALQQQFACLVRQVEAFKLSHRAYLSLNDTLCASLQHRAFAGEL